MASIFRRLFRRKKQPPLVCAVNLDNQGHPIGADPNHVHTAACFIDFESLAVVEFFQSQGCHSCPPAIPAIHEATSHPNLILLTYNVTLFDHLGWKDTFASAKWDQRQRAYITTWGRTSLFTPQIVVDGVSDGSGAGGKDEVLEIVDRARTIRKDRDWHIYADANETEVRIDSDKQEVGVHDIIMVVYKGGHETVKIGKGPNKGKKIDHRNIVTGITKIGEWTGGNLTIPIAQSKAALQADEDAVVLVQQGGPGGPIVAAAKILT